MKRADTIRVAAAGDVHASPERAVQLQQAFAGLKGQADLLLLAGDLTTWGEPEEADVLAAACREVGVPVLAVLGNHDWHSGRQEEIAATLETAGVQMLDRDWAVVDVDDTQVGVVGTKGFVGGFPDSELPDFGEPLLRRVYAETTEDVEALERGLQAVAKCAVRIVLLHYAPTSTTLEGEPRSIWAFLGSDRLGRPIAEYTPDLVVHGHGHAGTFEGFIGAVPVYNVAVPVMGRDFWVFDLPRRSGGKRA
jgi:Icc-related predicted phosphoesterase